MATSLPATSLPVAPALCTEEEFDYYVQDFNMKEILQTVAVLQQEMEREQRTFDKLSALISDLSPSCHGSTEYTALSNQMMESQARLAMLMGRNMKCFSQQTALQQEDDDLPAYFRSRRAETGSIETESLESNKYEQRTEKAMPEEAREYKKHRIKLSSDLSPTATGEALVRADGRRQRVSSSSVSSLDEPHGDETSARNEGNGECDEGEYSDSYNAAYMENGDSAFNDTYFDEDEPSSSLLGLVHNAEDINHTAYDKSTINFPKLEDNFSELAGLHNPREGSPPQAAKPKSKLVNRKVDQLKNEHRRFNMKQPQQESHDRPLTSNKSLEDLRAKYYNRPSLERDGGTFKGSTHSGEADLQEHDDVDCVEDGNNLDTTGSRNIGCHGIDSDKSRKQKTSPSAELPRIATRNGKLDFSHAFYQPSNKENFSPKRSLASRQRVNMLGGTRRRSAHDLYVVNKLFPIEESTDQEEDDLATACRKELSYSASSDNIHLAGRTARSGRRADHSVLNVLDIKLTDQENRMLQQEIGLYEAKDDDILRKGGADVANSDGKVVAKKQECSVVAEGANDRRDSYGDSKADYASTDSDSSDGSDKQSVSIVKTKVNFGDVKMKLRQLSYEKLSQAVHHQVNFVNIGKIDVDPNQDSSSTDESENAKDRGTEKEEAGILTGSSSTSDGGTVSLVSSPAPTHSNTSPAPTHSNTSPAPTHSNTSPAPTADTTRKDSSLVGVTHQNGSIGKVATQQQNTATHTRSHSTLNGAPRVSVSITQHSNTAATKDDGSALGKGRVDDIKAKLPDGAKVLPPAFTPGSGFTAEDKVSEKVTLMNWDPTKLLQDLYAIRLVPEVEKPPEYINIEGYLEKLPTNKKKATLLKTWKKRYFRTHNGKLLYYETRHSEKTHGYMQMTGGSVDVLGAHMLGVDDKRGHYLVIRAHTDEEYSKWKRALLSQTVDYCKMDYVKPVLVPNPALKRNVVIVDLGSCSVRAGILGDQPSLPTVFFPCIVASDKNNGRSNNSNGCAPVSGSDGLVLGIEAMKPSVRTTKHLAYPVKPSVKIDKFSLDMDVMPQLFQKVFNDLKIDPSQHWMMFSTPGNLGDKIKEFFMELFCDHFSMLGVNMMNQTLLSLYSYNSTSGIVVDIGERLEILPVTDGYIAEGGVTRQPYGGHRVTEALNTSLTEYKYRFFTDVEFQLVRLVAEKCCFVSEDYNTDKKRCTESVEQYQAVMDMSDYGLPNGTFRHIVTDVGRFHSPEGLFTNSVWGIDSLPLHKLVHKAIQACPIDTRKIMWRSIFLSGGTTCLPGLQERLQAELQKLAPPTVHVRVIASPQRYHAAYIGACTVAGLEGVFENSCISSKEWKNSGANSLRKWHLY